jgi:hypothetical protein
MGGGFFPPVSPEEIPRMHEWGESTPERLGSYGYLSCFPRIEERDVKFI